MKVNNHRMATRRSKPQPNQQQNADNSNNISHPPDSARPQTPTRHQEPQEALDGTDPTMSGSPNEREMPQSHIDDATFTVPISAEQRNFHNAPDVQYFATFPYPSQIPTGATCFPMVQTPTVNATQATGTLFFMFASLPVVPPIDICHQTSSTSTQTEVPRHSNQLHHDSDPTHFTHKEQSYLRTSGPMGTHEPQTPENDPVPHAFPHSFNSKDGISMMTDLSRISQDRNLSNLSEGQFVDISRHNRHLGQRQGNILTSTSSVNHPSSPLESPSLNHQRGGSSPHSTHNTNVGPTTYSGQYLGKISSVIDSSRLPPSTLPSDVLANQGTSILQHPIHIPSRVAFQDNTEHSDFSPHNLQSILPSGFDIQNYVARSTPSTGKNVRNISNPCFCEHVHELSSITDPINYAINSRRRSLSGLSTWAPAATSTPISSGKIQTPGERRTAAHHMSLPPRKLVPSLPSLPFLPPSTYLPVLNKRDSGTVLPQEMPSSRPERVARATTSPSEEELRDIMANAMPNSQTPQKTAMPTATSTPNSSGRILTSGERQTAHYHISVPSISLVPSLPSLPILPPIPSLPILPPIPSLPVLNRRESGAVLTQEMPWSGPERVARATTVPSEEELRDIMANAMANSQTSQETVMPTATRTPNSSGRILTSGERQTADHHISVPSISLVPSLPSLPILPPIPSLPVLNRRESGAVLTQEMPWSGPERVARATTLPSEEELRDIMANAMANSQTSGETVMPTATRTPNSSGRILTSGERQTAHYHISVPSISLVPSLPSLPILPPIPSLPPLPPLPSLPKPERVARATTLPSEEELRDIMANAMANSQTSRETVMPTSEGNNMTPATQSGQHAGNISPITPPRMMPSGSSGHSLPDINLTPATHFGQYSGNISSITPPSMMTTGSSGHFQLDINMTPTSYSGQYSGNISCITPPSMMTSGSSEHFISGCNVNPTTDVA
ncbi:proline-rich protein 36-like [Cryptotermes secundus]|uniref:proline-rich protein 36-like n=1 Tax=Cryptotermes secundus TaxID=105785 RepID=UPI001454C751|nr:proline-rich protein 36-like [Cryptotermes secundus]